MNMLHRFVDVSMAFLRCSTSWGAHVLEASYAYILCRFIELTVCLLASEASLHSRTMRTIFLINLFYNNNTYIHTYAARIDRELRRGTTIIQWNLR